MESWYPIISSSQCWVKLLGYIFPYCPAVGAIRRINSSNIDLQEAQCWSCNWECLYCDSSQDIRWNITWALRKSLGLRLYFIVYPSSCHNTDSVEWGLCRNETKWNVASRGCALYCSLVQNTALYCYEVKVLPFTALQYKALNCRKVLNCTIVECK